MTSSAVCRAADRLHQLADAGLDDETLRLETMQSLSRIVPVDGWAWAMSDPTSQLASAALAETPLEPRMLELLQVEDDPREINRRDALAASRTPVAALSIGTDGQLSRCRRWREHMVDFGVGDELRLVFADRTGCWAYLDLYTYGQRRYTENDLAFAGAVVSVLTAALRRAPTPESTSEPGVLSPGGVRDPAVLVLDPELSLVAQTGPAADWLPLLRRAPGDPLPCAILAATARALAGRSDRPAAVRQHAADGQWATVRAARLDTGGIAVTIDHSRAGEVLNYVARVAALTRRERQLLALLYEGHDTRAIAARLVIAETTVQDHVKNILVKTGHTSRRALLATLSPPAPPGE